MYLQVQCFHYNKRFFVTSDDAVSDFHGTKFVTSDASIAWRIWTNSTLERKRVFSPPTIIRKSQNINVQQTSNQIVSGIFAYVKSPPWQFCLDLPGAQGRIDWALGYACVAKSFSKLLCNVPCTCHWFSKLYYRTRKFNKMCKDNVYVPYW